MTDGLRRSSAAAALCVAGGLIFFLAATAPPALAQTGSASSAVLGTANNYSALVRGFGAVGVNPAGLGMPDGPAVSLAIPAVGVSQGLGPLTLRDVGNYAGIEIPHDQREEWLQRIEARGGQRGMARGDVSALALNLGGLGFQHTTVVTADMDLHPSIAELVFFGNAGRTGVPTDFAFAGSALNASAHSSFDVAYGFEVPLRLTGASNEAFAVGATGRYTVGHFLVLGRDLGSLATSDPLEMSIHFPVIEPDTDLERLNLGDGVGLDVGAMWRGGPWSVGASIRNLLNTFSWDEDAFVVRPGTAHFDTEGSNSDVDPIPITNAPPELLDALREMTLSPELTLGVGFRPMERLALTADYRGHFGDGIRLGPGRHLGAGAEFRLLSFLPLRAGVAHISDDHGGAIRLAGGATLKLGPVHLGGAGLVQTGDAGDGSTMMLTLSLGGQ